MSAESRTSPPESKVLDTEGRGVVADLSESSQGPSGCCRAAESGRAAAALKLKLLRGSLLASRHVHLDVHPMTSDTPRVNTSRGPSGQLLVWRTCQRREPPQ
eukprot:794213-Rhodomonas_salina.1